jgi:hypothetical protein
MTIVCPTRSRNTGGRSRSWPPAAIRSNAPAGATMVSVSPVNVTLASFASAACAVS